MDSAQRLLLVLGKELSPTKLLGVFRPAMKASKADVDCRATHRQEEQGGHVSLQSTRRSPLRLRYRSVQLSGEPNHFLIEWCYRSGNRPSIIFSERAEDSELRSHPYSCAL